MGALGVSTPWKKSKGASRCRLTQRPSGRRHGGQVRDQARTNAGKFRFHLKAPNGEIIAASQGYETKANAHKGIDAIKTHAPGAKVEDH
jgi:uncharacterized protein YegP (UPF0339 family)